MSSCLKVVGLGREYESVVLYSSSISKCVTSGIKLEAIKIRRTGGNMAGTTSLGFDFVLLDDGLDRRCFAGLLVHAYCEAYEPWFEQLCLQL